MKFKNYLKEAVQFASGQKVFTVYIRLDDSGSMSFKPTQMIGEFHLDADLDDLRKVFAGQTVRVGLGFQGRQSIANLMMEDDGTLCIKGILPGRVVCVDVNMKELKDLFGGRIKLISAPMWN